MPPGGGASRAWLRAAFALDSKASSVSPSLPPAFLCPSVRIAAAANVPLPAWGQPRFGPREWSRQRHAQRRSFSEVAAFAYETAPTASSFPETNPGPAEVSDMALKATPRSLRQLPLQCPGCGAFSQTTHADKPGYFNLSRQSTMEYLGLLDRKPRVRSEDKVIEDTLRRLEVESGGAEDIHLGSLVRPEESKDKQKNTGSKGPLPPNADSPILCIRCHDLVHHSFGKPIFHPDIDDIRETIAESPYKYNHVYHVLDAADFPMSLLPRIHELLDTMPLRSRNRRSRHGRFYGGRLTEISFVITRSDLFAQRKDQVDKLMPWIRETLREALGRAGRDVRLGNIRCVSARRNWWTKDLRDEIFKRGGANWLVGKANVGKSYLVHHVFPKGRMDTADMKKPPFLSLQKSKATGSYGLGPQAAFEGDNYDAERDAERAANLDDAGLLPPRPRETNYPQMPVVSALPGTTASPIRIPFGGGKGELIDLPGLARTALTSYVDESHQDSLVMKMRVQPEQVVLKGPWQSLLLGGFIRITPRTPDLVFLTYNFTPLHEHKTMTEKAVEIQAQTSELKVENIAVAGTGEKIKLAGSFELKYDVTKQRAGPITRKEAANIRVDRLPYRIVALDLLIEGCGWVEIVAQVRTRKLFNEDMSTRLEGKRNGTKANETDASGILQSLDLSELEDEGPDTSSTRSRKRYDADGSEDGKHMDAADDASEDPADVNLNWPVIDVYSPGGKFIGSRPPLNAWLMAQPKASMKKKSLRARPKKSMKGAKKREKASRRESI